MTGKAIKDVHMGQTYDDIICSIFAKHLLVAMNMHSNVCKVNAEDYSVFQGNSFVRTFLVDSYIAVVRCYGWHINLMPQFSESIMESFDELWSNVVNEYNAFKGLVDEDVRCVMTI